MNWTDDSVLLDSQPVAVGASVTTTPISQEFALTGPLNFVADLQVSDIGKTTAITVSLQTRSAAGAWIASKPLALSPTARVLRATFADQASTGAGDYVVVQDRTGAQWAVAADLTGSDPEPSGDLWAEIPADHRAQVDLSSAVTAEDVAIAFDAAFQALGGFSALFGTDSLFVPGDLTFQEKPTGSVSATLAAYNEDESGSGSITAAVAIAGFGPGRYSLRIMADVPTDGVYLPLRKRGRLVATTGTGDSVTFSDIVVTKGGSW